MQPKIPRQPATIWERLRFLLLMQCSGARAVVTTELDMTGFLDANRRLVLAAAAFEDAVAQIGQIEEALG
jgi:hypothetical protein